MDLCIVSQIQDAGVSKLGRLGDQLADEAEDAEACSILQPLGALWHCSLSFGT